MYGGQGFKSWMLKFLSLRKENVPCLSVSVSACMFNFHGQGKERKLIPLAIIMFFFVWYTMRKRRSAAIVFKGDVKYLLGKELRGLKQENVTRI